MDIPDTQLLDEFEDWLLHRRPHGATVIEGTMLMMSLLARMRAALTLPELHAVVHNMLLKVEGRLQDGATVTQEDGTTVPFILAEQWREMEGGSEIVNWLADPSVPDTVPQDWT